MKFRNVRTPLLTLSLGVLMVGLSAVFAYRHNWTPAEFSVNLKPGLVRSPQFRTDLKARYFIELEVDRTKSFERLSCLLGVGETRYDRERCQAITSPVDLGWSVLSPSGQVIANGRSSDEHRSGGVSGNVMSRVIGEFQSEAGGEYVVEILSLRDASELAPMAPRIKVQAIQPKGEVLAAGIGMTGGSLMVIFSLFWLTLRFKDTRMGSD